MKAKVYDIHGKASGEVELPHAFATAYRPDLIQRAVLALQSQRRQPYGTDKLAGLRTSAKYLGVKDTRGSMKNREIARITRVVGSNPGETWKGAKAPQTRGGRRAHPPKSEKIWALKINKKEAKLAVESAIAATTSRELALARGHRLPDGMHLPIILENKVEEMKKAKEVEGLVQALGFAAEMERAKVRLVRAG